MEPGPAARSRRSALALLPGASRVERKDSGSSAARQERARFAVRRPVPRLDRRLVLRSVRLALPFDQRLVRPRPLPLLAPPPFRLPRSLTGSSQQPESREISSLFSSPLEAHSVQ